MKSFKYFIKRLVTDSTLTFHEFDTIITHIQAILNSSLIFPLSNYPNDLHPLTPGHFLFGDALLAAPQEPVNEIPTNQLSHYEKIQQMTLFFWRYWSNDYLNTLQQSSK